MYAAANILGYFEYFARTAALTTCWSLAQSCGVAEDRLNHANTTFNFPMELVDINIPINQISFLLLSTIISLSYLTSNKVIETQERKIRVLVHNICGNDRQDRSNEGRLCFAKVPAQPTLDDLFDQPSGDNNLITLKLSRPRIVISRDEWGTID